MLSSPVRNVLKIPYFWSPNTILAIYLMEKEWCIISQFVRWVQTECRNLGDSDTPEVSDLLKTAARCLNERPVLFKYCAEEVCIVWSLSQIRLQINRRCIAYCQIGKRNSFFQVANTRHNSLFRRFISALTRGGPGGMPRPIEVHAHDPLRYVGDMLGWLHQVRNCASFIRFVIVV